FWLAKKTSCNSESWLRCLVRTAAAASSDLYGAGTAVGHFASRTFSCGLTRQDDLNFMRRQGYGVGGRPDNASGLLGGLSGFGGIGGGLLDVIDLVGHALHALTE